MNREHLRTCVVVAKQVKSTLKHPPASLSSQHHLYPVMGSVCSAIYNIKNCMYMKRQHLCSRKTGSRSWAHYAARETEKTNEVVAPFGSHFIYLSISQQKAHQKTWWSEWVEGSLEHPSISGSNLGLRTQPVEDLLGTPPPPYYPRSAVSTHALSSQASAGCERARIILDWIASSMIPKP